MNKKKAAVGNPELTRKGKNMKRKMFIEAKECKSVKELLDLAKENNVEMTVEQAERLFAKINSKGAELADGDLEKVSGGGNYDPFYGILSVDPDECCNNYEPKKKVDFSSIDPFHFDFLAKKEPETCSTCRYSRDEDDGLSCSNGKELGFWASLSWF